MKRGGGRTFRDAVRAWAREVRGRLVRHARLSIGLAAFFMVAVTALWELDLLSIREVERGAYDRALELLTEREERSDQVVVLAVDDDTLQYVSRNRHLRDRYGPWPYQRLIWADIIPYLAKDGARALVFDLVMDEQRDDQYNLAFARAIRATGLPVYVGAAVHVPEREAYLLPKVEPWNRLPGERPKRERVPLPGETREANADVLPSAFAIGGDAPEPAPTPEQLADRRRWVAEQLAFPLVTQIARPLASPITGAPQVPLPPVPLILDELSGVGLVDPEVDPDGVLRRTRFAYRDGHNTYPTLPLTVAADLLGAREVALRPGELQVGGRTFRVNADGSAKIDYGGTLFGAFDVVKLFSVFPEADGTRTIEPGFFRDKVVVVGGVAVATQDTHPTPFASISPGVVKQASVLHTLLSGGEFIVDAPLWLRLLVTLLIALLSAALVTSLHSSAFDVLWPLALYAGFFVVSGLGIVLFHVHVPSTPAVWAGVGTSITATAITRLFADRNRERLKESFGRYLDRSLVEEMAASNELPRLEGENREITAFFSDIRGFSSFSEAMKDDPQKLVRILNTYLTRVSAALMREGGCIDKYIGDAVVCLYGAPLRQEDHAVRACRGALAVQAEVAKLREEFRRQGLPDVYTRVGLNSGVMFVGNFGSEQLFDYTAMGDDMNLASRLEGANKAYGTHIMVGEKTYALAKDHVEVRELDRVRVAGKSEPAVVYELLGMKGQVPKETLEGARLYEEALGHYRSARFEAALESLARLDALRPGDGPAQTLRRRCEALRGGAPEGFDGVANLEK